LLVCKCNHFRQVKSTQQRGFHIGRPSFSLVGQQLVRNSGGEETLEQRQYSLHLIKGNELFQQKRYRDAVVEYTSALQAQPKDLNALMYLAAAHEALGNTKKTIEYSTAAIERGTEISTDNSNIAKYEAELLSCLFHELTLFFFFFLFLL
jgi:tetratricopeptide (TPR) repeat protein